MRNFPVFWLKFLNWFWKESFFLLIFFIVFGRGYWPRPMRATNHVSLAKTRFQCERMHARRRWIDKTRFFIIWKHTPPPRLRIPPPTHHHHLVTVRFPSGPILFRAETQIISFFINAASSRAPHGVFEEHFAPPIHCIKNQPKRICLTMFSGHRHFTDLRSKGSCTLLPAGLGWVLGWWGRVAQGYVYNIGYVHT